MLFRILTALAAVLTWLMLAFLLEHESKDPALLGRFSVGYAIACLTVAACATALTVICVSSPAFHWFRTHSRNFLLLGTTIILLLASIELTVRTLDIIGVSYYERLSEYQNDLLSDSDLIYRHQSNFRAVYGGVELDTNELGMRDDQVGPKAPDEFRILALGDSVTLGWQVPAEYTFVNVLEGLLNDTHEGHIRILNSGVGSYNTEQEEAFLKKYSSIISPDVVLLTYVNNDVIIHGPFRRESSDRPNDADPLQRLQRLLWRAWTTRLVLHLLRHGRVSRESTMSVSTEGKTRSLAALERIIEFCRQSNIALAVVTYEHLANEATSELAHDVRALAETHDVPTASTAFWLDGTDPESVLISRTDPHLSVAGHRLVAEGLRDFFLKNRASGLLPAPINQ
jgi:lysophospholipase L1-like esterase